MLTAPDLSILFTVRVTSKAMIVCGKRTTLVEIWRCYRMKALAIPVLANLLPEEQSEADSAASRFYSKNGWYRLGLRTGSA